MSSQNSIFLRKHLEDLVIVSPEFKALEDRRLGFCPFEAMGIVDAEIRHANFLASMMDPFRPHGIGSRFLREVLDAIVAEIGEIGGISRLKLHLLDLDDADIKREWNHVDLLVAFPRLRLVIAFELKIGASEGKDQLRRYRAEIERQWPSTGNKPWTHLLLFLTRDRQEPNDEAWHPVTYDIIIDAISRVLELSKAGEPLARDMLKAYASMLRKHHMEDQELSDLARDLWQRHREALEYLMEQRPNGLVGLGPVALEQIKDIAEKASLPILHLEPEDSTKANVRFFVREWESLPGVKSGSGWISSGRMLVLETQFRTDQVKVALLVGPGPAEVRKCIFEVAQPGIIRASARFAGKWKTLASAQLITAADLEEGSDAAITNLAEALKRFVEGPVTKFNKLFMPLLGVDKI
jgi:hypothetical protein